MGDPKRVSKGLDLIYKANVVVIASSICLVLSVFLLPILGPLAVVVTVGLAIAVLIGGLMSLVGLVDMRNEHSHFMKALILCAIGIVLSLLARGDSIFATVMGLAQTGCSLAQTYFLIEGTQFFLSERKCFEEQEKGGKAWQWALGTAVAGVVFTFCSAAIFVLAGVLAIVNLVVAIVAFVHMQSYLKASSAALSQD